ncbi:MAG: galactokinase family protein [Coriobacteriales bacterium]|nr:galactokinase family protein [Coriobacteriales bacterium]
MSARADFGELIPAFEDAFGSAANRRLLAVRAPGRTEIAGNHTDHEGGSVIAAAVDRYVEGIFSPAQTGVMRVQSEGYGLVEVEVTSTEAREDERGTTAALVRGMAAQFALRGIEPQGFDACLRSDVLGGSGLSSSAAFELELGQAMNALWADGSLAPDELAMMAQRAEREWFGKPCGLMDQAAVALGGVQHMDFGTPGVLEAEALDFDFAEHGYAICIVAVGADHAANIDDYAAVPGEMQAVARELGAQILSEVRVEDVIAAMPRIRETLGDRAALRALHYYQEEWLVTARAHALKAEDMGRFLELTRISGRSSAMFLQNVSIGGSAEQPSMLAIALADGLLCGQGAVRVHGGGFGGTIQAFVPTGVVDEFSAGMNAVFGEGACGVYGVDHEGAKAWWM